jgi:hypothetical protein
VGRTLKIGYGMAVPHIDPGGEAYVMNDRPMRSNRPDDFNRSSRPSFSRPSSRPLGGKPQRPQRQYPLLLGEPSPSLAKINRASIEELQVRIDKLLEEAGHITKRIEALTKLTPPDEAKIKVLKDQLRRLRLLETKARERMEDKKLRKEQWEQRGGGRDPGAGGGHGGQRGGQGGGFGDGQRPMQQRPPMQQPRPQQGPAPQPQPPRPPQSQPPIQSGGYTGYTGAARPTPPPSPGNTRQPGEEPRPPRG